MNHQDWFWHDGRIVCVTCNQQFSSDRHFQEHAMRILARARRPGPNAKNFGVRPPETAVA